MIITMDKAEVEKGVSVATLFSDKTFGNITIEGKSDSLQIKSSNGEEEIVCKNIGYKSSDKKPFSFSVNGKKLLAVIKNVKSDEVKISIAEKNISVLEEKSRYRIEIADMYESINMDVEQKQFKIQNYVENMKKVLHCIDQNNPTFALTGALIEKVDDKLFIVATDTRRLSVFSQNEDCEDFKVIIPKKGINSILKIFSSSDDIVAGISENKIIVQNDNLWYSIKVINSNFPDWRRIIKDDSNVKINLNKAVLAGLLKDATIFREEVIVSISKGKIIIEDIDSNSKTGAKIYIGNDIDIQFAINGKMLLDFLASIDEEDIELWFDDEDSPITLYASQAFRELMVPMLLDNSLKQAA